jgi:adenine-specific DNA-methyltransferase
MAGTARPAQHGLSSHPNPKPCQCLTVSSARGWKRLLVKVRAEVSSTKIRGGFYTPESLVQACYQRVFEVLPNGDGLSLLEPSAGDGAFIRGLGRHPLYRRISDGLALEPLADEAAKCQEAVRTILPRGRVVVDSFLRWAEQSDERFDVAVGNPPFVRFQFVGTEDMAAAGRLAASRGHTLRRVSNLWIPIFIEALRRLRSGGAFAFVIPSECFTGVSAGAVRDWLLANVDELRADLFPPGSFPAVLQQVIVLSGTRRAQPTQASTRLSFVEHLPSNGQMHWHHYVPVSTDSWTRYLLTPDYLETYDSVKTSSFVRRLGDLAKLEVSTVTGANDFFSIDRDTRDDYELGPWSLPLLARVRLAPGLRFDLTDHENLVGAGEKAFLLYFDAELPSPEDLVKPLEYLTGGIAAGIPDRYKCSIRSPWYRVPLIQPRGLMLSKRSHHYPRLLLNGAQVVTTDTIYQGDPGAAYRGRERDLVAAFHNSLTLLSAEIEGRSFGGGVLELVPSETARLAVPVVDGFGEELQRLDQTLRTSVDPMALVDETDLLLAKGHADFAADDFDTLRRAHEELSRRRFDRN